MNGGDIGLFAAVYDRSQAFPPRGWPSTEEREALEDLWGREAGEREGMSSESVAGAPTSLRHPVR